ncbi:MAG: hypothetical protein LBT86_01965 [Deltaproteobacteria bacterium]|jgi:hypothetical protein|nr:hypothetical protein [Deltaproteobacteria bacterium]
MSHNSFIGKLGSFLILSLYIIAIVLTFYLFVVITSGMAMAEDIVWDDPNAVPSFVMDLELKEDGIYPASSLSKNNVKILVDVNAHIAGGYIYKYLIDLGEANVSQNKVTVLGNTNNKDVYGGYARSLDSSASFLVNDNQVEIFDSVVNDVVGGLGRANGCSPSTKSKDLCKSSISNYYVMASRNEIRLSGVTVSNQLVGGYVTLMYLNGQADANRNKVYFENGTAKVVIGGYASNDTDPDGVGRANFNEVYLKDVKVTDYVHVGTTQADKYSQTINNYLTLEGDTSIGGDIRGGDNQDWDSPTGTSDHFTGNVLRVYRPKVSGISVGGNVDNFQFYDFSFSSLSPSGSVGLRVEKQLVLNDGAKRGSSVRPVNIINEGLPTADSIELILFDSPNFDIDYKYFKKPADTTEPFGPLLTYDLNYAQSSRRLSATFGNFRAAEETVILPDGPSAGVDLINEGGDLAPSGGGDPIDYYGSDDGGDSFDNYGPEGGVDPGDNYGPDDEFDPLDNYGPEDGLDPLDKDSRDGGVNPLDKENREEGFGQDAPYMDRQKEAENRLRPDKEREDQKQAQNRLRAEKEREDKRRAAKRAKAKAVRLDRCPRVFLKTKGGRIKRSDDRELSLTSYSLLTGVDCGRRFNSGLMTFGVAFEGGLGSYDSKRSLTTGLIRGSGDLDYAGAVFLGRFDFRPSQIGRFYLESSFRVGKLNSDFQTGDFPGANGRRISYDTNNSYVGFQIGVGDYIPINQLSYLNVYAQYFQVRLKGGDIKLNTGEVVNIKNINSSRLRSGTQYHRAVSDHWRFFGGAAYEREIGGQTNAYYARRKLPSTSKKGHVGLFEMGMAYSSKSTKPVTFSLALQGNVGDRRGGAGVAQLAIVF